MFACSFRLTGRLHRREPELSRVLLNNVLRLLSADNGLAPRARRDIEAAAEAGRFDVEDLDVAVTMAAGALIALGQLLHDQPERDVEETTDRVTEDLLRMFGVPRRQAQRIASLPLPDSDAAQATVRRLTVAGSGPRGLVGNCAPTRFSERPASRGARARALHSVAIAGAHAQTRARPLRLHPTKSSLRRGILHFLG